MAKTEELDKDLLEGLKLAKSKRVFFAVALKGGADGSLIVSKTKIPAPEIDAAKKKSGGSAVVKGACFVEDGKHIFETAKVPAATMANALKLIAKRDSGLTIHPICRQGTDPDLFEDGEAPPSDSSSPTAKKSEQVDGRVQGPMPKTPQYETALKTWEQASAVALSATDKLISSLRSTDDELASDIADVIDKMRGDFPDTLDEALTGLHNAAKNGLTADAAQYQVKAEIAVRAAIAFLNNNAQTIEGCENNPFGVNVPFRAPLSEALKQVLANIK